MNAILKLHQLGLGLYTELWAGGLDHGEDLEYFIDQSGIDADVQRRVSAICEKQLGRDMDSAGWPDRDPIEVALENV